MKIVVINGTAVKGCTYQIKECFLSFLRPRNTITEFYLPKDLPHFCEGCKNCFFRDEKLCPHVQYVAPIWNAMAEADLIVFAAPVYALRTTAQVKSLLDHLCCHWMVHRPEPAMFTKRAVILTNSVGAPNTAAQRDIATSLTWLGVSHIRGLGFGLMEGVIWEEISEKRRLKIQKKAMRLARKYPEKKPARMSLIVHFYFTFCKITHNIVLKKEAVPSADNQYWIDKGWIRSR